MKQSTILISRRGVAFLLAVVFSLLYYNKGYGQESKVLEQALTIQFKDDNIVSALRKIEQLAPVGFMYDAGELKRSEKKITADFKAVKLSVILSVILKSSGYEYKLLKDKIIIHKASVTPGQIPAGISVSGHVADGKTGQGLAGVTVHVKGGRAHAVTDAAGDFIIPVPDADAVLAVSYVGYEGKEIKVAGLSAISISLNVDSKSLGSVVVQAHRKVDNEAALLNDRKAAAVVSDGISSQNIEKTASLTTTQALQRVTGVTITDDRYVAIRGMGDRSVIAELNGARLSSSDPDRSAVPLDLVPAALLDNLTVYKTMTPDKPADASAGIVELKTKSVPDTLTLVFSTQLGTNSTIGISGKYNSFVGSDMGFFGERVKDHNLSGAFLKLKDQYPGGLSQIQQLFLQSRNSPALSKEALRINNIMQSFPAVLTTTYKPAAPNQIYTVSFGNKYMVWGHQLGVVVGLNYYSRTEDRYNGQVNQYSIYQGIVTGSTDIFNPLHIPGFITPDHPRMGKYLGYRENSGTATLNYGALAGLTYRINTRNQVQFQYVGSRGAETQANSLNGSWQNTGLQFPVYNQVFQLKQSYRVFNTFNLQGEHRVVPGKYSPTLSYNLSSSKSTQNEPDFRFTDLADYRKTAFIDPNGQGINSDTYAFVVGSVHGVGPNGVLNADPNGRKYRYLTENNYNAKVDITQPVMVGGQRQLLKFGYNYLRRKRDFTENVLGLPGTSAGGNAGLLTKAAGNLDQLVSYDNIGLNPSGYDAEGSPRVGGFLYQIRKSPNNYNGVYKTQAFYGMVDAHVGERLRITGGVRFESTDIQAHVDTVNVFNPQVAAGSISGGASNQGGGTTQPNTGYKVDFKPYYSANLTYTLNRNMNFRLGYSTTLARPELRELTNIFEFDPFQFAVIGGNPNLKNQFTRSEDFRWEWFPRPGEVFAASVFAKQIDHQLNKVFIYHPQGAVSTFPEFPLIEYQNDVNQGHLFGIELEIRKNLGQLTGVLRNFFIGGNFMLAYSQITKNPERLEASRTIDRTASDKSPLFEQPPYSINGYLDYDNARMGTQLSVNFNIVGERLVQVQLDGSPDVYSRPVPVLDLVFSQRVLKRVTVKGFAKNILNPPYRDVYATPRKGGLYHDVLYIQHQYWRGAEYALGITYNLF
ncbi:MAG: TonB-dependent receptor [Chitinophagaceae bacterium]|nr:TonB-dependent receptor [Chitinophagaceae bacterium]